MRKPSPLALTLALTGMLSVAVAYAQTAVPAPAPAIVPPPAAAVANPNPQAAAQPVQPAPTQQAQSVQPAAGAQQPAAANDANVGFFRPQADPSLTNPPPAPRAQPSTAAAPEMARSARAAEPVLQPSPLEVMQWHEQQLDRAEVEAMRERQRRELAPQPINGAFDGLTSERDR